MYICHKRFNQVLLKAEEIAKKHRDEYGVEHIYGSHAGKRGLTKELMQQYGIDAKLFEEP